VKRGEYFMNVFMFENRIMEHVEVMLKGRKKGGKKQ
jgi:hypothetical protein